MKVLKSGIEVDPNDMDKLKGGSCSCACNRYVSGSAVNVAGHEGETCSCWCWEPWIEFRDQEGDDESALNYI